MKTSSQYPCRRILMVILTSTVTLLVVNCSGQSEDPLSPGASVSSDDAKHTFDKLMKRPDIEQATRIYGRMQDEIRDRLSKQVPSLSEWRAREEDGMAACDPNSYPGVMNDASVNALPNYVASGSLSDVQYEDALNDIGNIAQRYGFNPKPQRLYDEKEVHDAIFHNIHDDGKIRIHVERGINLGVMTGCYLTAESKTRGHPSG